MGPRDRFYPYLYHCDYIGLLGTGFMQVFHLGRAPRTKETLPDFQAVTPQNPGVNPEQNLGDLSLIISTYQVNSHPIS